MKEQMKNWQEAQDFCKAIGGDLMSIHSMEDLKTLPYASLYWHCVHVRAHTRHFKCSSVIICFLLLLRMFGSNAWIGLRLKGANEGYVWSDDSPVRNISSKFASWHCKPWPNPVSFKKNSDLVWLWELGLWRTKQLQRQRTLRRNQVFLRTPLEWCVLWEL